VLISQLEGKSVALWGWGREGHAAYAAIRARLPQQPLTLFCPAGQADSARALGDALLDGQGEPDAAALSAFQVVIKSPGISPYGPRPWPRSPPAAN
jgi:UDP-N-acetylmuramoylalanine-D-glutamate ligase